MWLVEYKMEQKNNIENLYSFIVHQLNIDIYLENGKLDHNVRENCFFTLKNIFCWLVFLTA